MTALEQLNAYLRRLELRLRLFAATRGTALIAGLALILTVALVWISNRYEFAERVVFPMRILLFFALAVAISIGLGIPLLKLNRRRVTRLAENRVPGFEERLLTVAERPDAENPFTELVAEDALRVAREHQPEQLTPTRSLLGFLGSGVAAAAVLLWLIAAGPGYWGYGASLLWTGNGSAGKRPLYDIGVQPGNKTIRRKTDQKITAQLFGFSAHKVTLHTKYGNALKWDETAMQAKSDGSGYQFLFAGLSDPVEYYVQADSAQSKHFTINVKDLPGVKRVRVALHFPAGLGLKDTVQDPGGDVRAVQGSQADISVLTDRPLDHGSLVLENGSKTPLARRDGNWLTARLPIEKDGSYHIAALDGGEQVRISDDYFIEAKKDEPPAVKILRPGHDPRVTPIEEVPVTVEASDDFGVEDLELHYSVNGGAEQVVPLLKTKGTKEAEGKTMLSFENFKVAPGDLVSFYATARDAKNSSQTDIVFAQAEPFDFKFTQSQQAGGMGGGMGMGDQDNNISERQKQIIAATFNEVRTGNKARAAIEQNARFLSDMEGKLGEQAKTLAERMGNRELGSISSEFAAFSKLMTDAAAAMGDAVNQLKPAKWRDALAPEQKALQSLLRAEALFRNIQVAFGQAGGGMGGGGAQRDLARMFDLELDTTKNQYETQQSDSSSQNDQQKAVDEAFQRLQMLARRQQELASRNSEQQPMEQRWEEEQLRREAEELRQQMQQLAKNGQSQQSSSSSQNNQQGQNSQQSSSSSSSSSSSQGSRQSGRQANGRTAQSDQQNQRRAEALKQAMNSLQRAEDEMRKAVSNQDATARQRASAELQQAQDLLNQMLHQQNGNSVSDLAQRAQEVANAQKEIGERMKQMYGDRGPGSRSRQESANAGGENGMPEMNDPNSMRGFSGFRRRMPQEMQSGRAPTEQESVIAGEKERMAQQLEQIQREMQQQAQSMAGSQPDAASKLRRALSDAEQKELAMRMQKEAEWMRQGFGERNAGMEDSLTSGLEQLSQQLQDIQGGIKAGNQPNQNGQNDKTAEALAQVRALREQLEQGAEQPQRGDQQGQQNGQPGGDQARTGGAYSPRGGAGDPRGLDPRGIQDTIGRLYGLRGQVDPRDRALYGYIDGALWNLRHLTGAQAGLLDTRISQDAVASLERLEVELSKRAGQQQSQAARSSAPEPSPEKYRDAVSEYFKKLSQPK
jgi:hypothetical protein